MNNLIKYYRKKYNITQEELSSFTDISQNMISDYENYKSIPNLINAEKLCLAFHCHLYKIFVLESVHFFIER